MTDFSILQAFDPTDMHDAAVLFRRYAASLPIDLAYQDFEAELAGLPGGYAPPRGALLIARDRRGRPLGCVALRPSADAGACEMKRLFVDPQARGAGIGAALISAILRAAEAAGHREMRLDTLPSMTSAVGLYRRFGFVAIDAYYTTPIPETLFFSRRLEALR
jgi:ribosomal protein S18 acetylase RimI-like enzyme